MKVKRDGPRDFKKDLPGMRKESMKFKKKLNVKDEITKKIKGRPNLPNILKSELYEPKIKIKNKLTGGKIKDTKSTTKITKTTLPEVTNSDMDNQIGKLVGEQSNLPKKASQKKKNVMKKSKPNKIVTEGNEELEDGFRSDCSNSEMSFDGYCSDEETLKSELDIFMKELNFEAFSNKSKDNQNTPAAETESVNLLNKNVKESKNKAKNEKNTDIPLIGETVKSKKEKLKKDKLNNDTVIEGKCKSKDKTLKNKNSINSNSVLQKENKINSEPIFNSKERKKESKKAKVDKLDIECKGNTSIKEKNKTIKEKQKSIIEKKKDNNKSRTETLGSTSAIKGSPGKDSIVRHGFNIVYLAKLLKKPPPTVVGNISINEKNKKRTVQDMNSKISKEPIKKVKTINTNKNSDKKINKEKSVNSQENSDKNSKLGKLETKEKKTDKIKKSVEESATPKHEKSKENKLEKISEKSKENKFERESERKLREIESKENYEVDEWKAALNSRVKSAAFRMVNEQLYTASGSDSFSMFKKDPEAFKIYHEGYTTQVESWPMHPLKPIQRWLVKKPRTWVVADFGCGDARLSKMISNKEVHSLDLIAANPKVTVCDMANTPLKSESVDVAVFCLSLMGTNISQFILEANRVLRVGGFLKIAEVESRFDKMNDFIRGIEKLGFRSSFKNTNHKYFWLFDFVKTREFGGKEKIPEICLKPCIYKKR